MDLDETELISINIRESSSLLTPNLESLCGYSGNLRAIANVKREPLLLIQRRKPGFIGDTTEIMSLSLYTILIHTKPIKITFISDET